MFYDGKQEMIKLLILALFTVLLNQAAFAYKLVKGDEFDCVQEVIPSSGLPHKIVTDQLESSVYVKTCDGDYMIIAINVNAITLKESSLAISPKPPSNQKNQLLDSEISSSKSIERAWLTGSTRRYRHNILGDDVEASGLAVIDRSGKRYELTLGKDSVFEDRKIRIADLDQDGKEELIVVRSYLNRGGAMAVYGLRDGKIKLIDETPAIGIPNRWLNPAVVADVDNDGKLEIAYVETPHIGGILHVMNLVNGKLVYKYKSFSTSNHGIGSRIQELAAAVDWNGDGVTDIAVPNANRTGIKVFSYAKKKAELIAEIDLGNRILSAIVAADLNRDKKPELYFSLFDGRLVMLTP